MSKTITKVCSVLLAASVVIANAQEVVERSQGGRAEAAYLDQEYAQSRSAQVDNVSYRLYFDLTGGDEEFSGNVDIGFELIHADTPLSVDFNGGHVESVAVNGNAVDFEYNGYFIEIASGNLVAGDTSLLIEFSHPFSRTGAGLYRFVDPVDETEYMYTDFEPYDANQLFPAFDQPDLKATYELRVAAPDNWTVISYARESGSNLSDGVRNWHFPESRPFSTYIFSLHAGDYRVWESNAGDIPLRLMARQSLGDYVVPADWFNATRKGFGFFEEYFDIDYPFGKYDQVIVPDFNAGAMENVAAVTFSERYIRRGDYTQRDLDAMESVILHEMAHMWFGDLVTMRWWNGLWLNESFASYMANLAASSGDPVTDWWLRFFLGSKQWAYATDEQVTNHPIELPVANTSEAFANFDGITYGKGASVLKQLSYLIGAENFRQGVSNYLKEMSYANSELSDFIGALADAADRNLEGWSDDWLYTKGLNTVSASVVCSDGMLDSIVLQQGQFEEGVPMHEHKLEVALFKVNDSQGVQLIETQGVVLEGETTPLEISRGTVCPQLVFPNYNDQAYIKSVLQDSDIDLLEASIGLFTEPLLRAMLWRALWEGVRDARIPLSRYREILLDNITAESNPDILVKLLGAANDTMAWYLAFGSDGRIQAEQFSARFSALAWDQVTTLEPGGDMQKFWFDSLVSNTVTLGSAERLLAVISGEEAVPGLALDQDRRWRVLQRLAGLQLQDIEEPLSAELQRDKSDQGVKSHLSAQVLGSDVEQKAEWLNDVLFAESDRSQADRRVIMRALFTDYQPEIQEALMGDVLAAIPAVVADGGQTFVRDFSGSLLHGSCSEESEAGLARALADNLSAPATIDRRLRVQIQEDQRCQAIKALDGF